MKKLVSVLVLVLFVAVNSATAGPGDKKMSPEERSKKMIEKMKENLNLSDDQVTKIEALNTTKMSKMKALKDSMKDSEEAKSMRKEMKTKREAIGKEFKVEMKEILTSEQYPKFEEQLAKMKEKRKEGMSKRKEKEEK